MRREACRWRIVGALAVAGGLTLAPAGAAGQTPADTGRLLVTVADQSGAVIPGATVTVTGTDETTARMPTAKVVTSEVGVASIEALPTGRYAVRAEFPGFEAMEVRDLRVRRGDNRRSVVLPIKRVAEDVTVGRDGRTSSLDSRGNAFATVLTREQIEALPDDPDEMAAALKAMSPPGATLRIDGFTGGKLPPKSHIRSIRLPRMDMMAAQNHGGMNGLMFIDIMTQPGNGPLRGSIDFTFRDAALNARNPFTPVKGDEGLKQGGVSLSGSIVPGKSSFSLNVQTARQFDSTSLLAALPGSTTARAVRQPTDRMTFTGRFDQAINRDHMLRASFTRSTSDRSNLGVGGYDLAERAFSTDATDNTLRVSENGAVGRRMFSESRLQVHWSDSRSTPAFEAPTVRVLDAFTNGGAQQSGGRRAVDFEAATDLDYVRGAHSFRTGVLVEGGRYRSNLFSNYLGTFTFASLADYEAGRPSNYTRRIGDPNVEYSNLQFGVYAQDDHRLARSLMLSYGLRYEAQTLLDDQKNFSPRATLTWSPFKSGRTTVRGGWGYFTDWLDTGTYEQALVVDGARQREINVVTPTYPEAVEAGGLLPTNRYLLADGLALPNSMTANAGVDQTIGKAFRLSASYAYRRGSGLLRGRNLNGPVAGVRPDPSFANIVEVIGDAGARVHSFGLTASFIKLEWHRTFLAANYTFSRTRSNATGAFSLPANGDDLSTEWGPISPRHRFGGSFSTQIVRNLGVTLNFRAQAGSPYNVTTGRDGNADGVFNDRPAGVGRNSALTAPQWDLGMRVSYAIGFGTRPQAAGPGGGSMIVMIGGGGGGMTGGFGGGADNSRFRVEFYASAQNITNHRNYIGYSGVLTSPFFGAPTSVLNPRKVELGVRFGF
jgi:Carboxypeptidase regulatory-like domain